MTIPDNFGRGCCIWSIRSFLKTATLFCIVIALFKKSAESTPTRFSPSPGMHAARPLRPHSVGRSGQIVAPSRPTPAREVQSTGEVGRRISGRTAATAEPDTGGNDRSWRRRGRICILEIICLYCARRISPNDNNHENSECHPSHNTVSIGGGLRQARLLIWDFHNYNE